jgi:Fe2+ transport system protein FeoA
MTLNEASLNQRLKVLSFSDEEHIELNDLESRLIHLGFHFGSMIRIVRRAPLFQEPLLVEVRGRLVAMTLSESLLIKVEAV